MSDALISISMNIALNQLNQYKLYMICHMKNKKALAKIKIKLVRNHFKIDFMQPQLFGFSPRDL